jgi:hypothetical protein
MMKKHQLLEKAMRDYQAGTSYTALGTHSKVVSDGVFYVSSEGTKILQTENGIAHSVYDGLRWAPTLSDLVKPDKIRLFEDTSAPTIVKADSVFFDGTNGSKINITADELEVIYAAYKSLQP